MVIGLAGYAQSGKDSLFNLFVEHGTRNYKRYAFADALKKEIQPTIQRDFGFDIFAATIEQKSQVRHLLVELGAKRRAENPLYWVDQVYKEIRQTELAEKVLRWDRKTIPVITDMRYVNEANFFKGLMDLKLIPINRFGNSPANIEELEFTTPLYTMEGAIGFSWSDLHNYAPEDLQTIVNCLEDQIFS